MDRTVSSSTNRLLFFDMVRNLARGSVVLYHAVAAHSINTPHWSVHDGSSMTADMTRQLFDLFMVPVFFFRGRLPRPAFFDETGNLEVP
jgi:hypothetical protein